MRTHVSISLAFVFSITAIQTSWTFSLKSLSSGHATTSKVIFLGSILCSRYNNEDLYKKSCLYWLAKSRGANDDDVMEEGDDGDGDDELLNMEAFQRAKDEVEAKTKKPGTMKELEDFDGYKLRDVIYEKWGACYDVDFNRVDAFGFRNVYLNVLPFQLGRRPFRHKTELDYLCHLQAVVEILQKYNQLGYILYQIQETDKKPRPNTSPIVAVPLRLDLTPEEVDKVLNYS